MFVTVVETEGFASAARKLNVSPSVVSRMVTELEERLGVRLLTRTTRIVRLTDAGATYFEDCRRILGEIDAAEVTATGTHAAPRGQLTVTAPVVFGKVHLMPIVLDYLTRYPAVNVNCWFLDRIVNLVDEGADVAVRIGELPSSSLQADRSGQEFGASCARRPLTLSNTVCRSARTIWLATSPFNRAVSRLRPNGASLPTASRLPSRFNPG